MIPFLTNTDDVSQMDWCSYALESMVRGCKEYYLGKYFSGPLLLMAIIYVNSTVSAIVKVEKTVPAFMSWNSNLMLKREQEEIELGGFGHLSIVEGLQEMKDILRQNLVKCNKLMVDTDSKLKIALRLNPKDKELKKIIEERNNLFLDFYKEEDNNGNIEGEEIDGDKNRNTNETECDTDREEVEGNKDECEEDKGNEEQQETYRKSNEDESQNEAKHNESDNIDNIGNLSLSAGQNTTINALVESTVNATVESTDNFVDVLPQICVDAQKDKNIYAKEIEAVEKQQKEKKCCSSKGK
nr:ulp1 protease family, C-terminal catalytic domain-containing protein [Tanacetum cinerariifolium]